MIQVTVKNSKTGSQYICKSARRTVKNITYNHITYHLICRHKDHPFFKQFYHGPKGIYIDSPRYKERECPTFDEETANYIRERLELYLKSWVLPKLNELSK